jgi:beta-ribofuranosylaminobenzene 5'-phosphate synthase
LRLETSARLHLSLIDLNGSEGRVDGGIGIAIKEPSLIIECEENDSQTEILFNDKCNISNSDDEYTSKMLIASKNMQDYLGIEKHYTFNVEEIYPIHQGLGLGTQLLLSTGQLIAKLNEVDLGIYELAKIIHRGGTSGIGVHSFKYGGLLIDGGHRTSIKNDFLPSSASNVAPPPLLARYDFPEDWNIILAIPNTDNGASGTKEVNIFQSYSPVDIRDVERISYLTLMKLMPAVIEEDITYFGDAINKIQSIGFKKVERNLQSDKINNTINYMIDNGIPGAGMSSFGPTCFGITDTNPKAIKRDLIDLMDNDGKVIITKGKNHGACIKE